MLTPRLVSEVIKELEKQKSYAPYETRLLNASRNWLRNFNRRRYGLEKYWPKS